MGITVIVRSAGPEKVRLTFDGTQRVVIGRGSGSDVRLPDTSVSHRHATLRAQGAEFVLVDEGSTNGTFIGQVRIAPNTSRLVRSGDRVRVGRIWLELRMDRDPITRDLALATRDLALALVAEAIEAAGADTTTRVRVVEGADQGSALVLTRLGHEYVIGRAAHCDLRLSDPDVSREHLRVVRQDDGVTVIDADTKNGTAVGSARASPRQPAPWRPARMIQIGRTVLSLEEPLIQALARIEGSPDERIGEVDGSALDSRASAGDSCAHVESSSPAPSSSGVVPRSPSAGPDRPAGTDSDTGGAPLERSSEDGPSAGPAGSDSPAGSVGGADAASSGAAAGSLRAAGSGSAAGSVGGAGSGSAAGSVGGAGGSGSGELSAKAAGRAPVGVRWSGTDVAVMTAAVGVLAISLAGLVWLLRG